ncbi:MAG: sporulation transcriptional regulator SpoIIID [Clostridia bacterium]|nr:sporulation transcriptional regulator SpoIIID [Clostridia bacterium]
MTDKDILTLKLGAYIADSKCTVRAAAREFDMGKSTVHKHVTERLPKLDPALAERVRDILDYNLSVRHIRGGEATKIKCAKHKSEI